MLTFSVKHQVVSLVVFFRISLLVACNVVVASEKIFIVRLIISQGFNLFGYHFHNVPPRTLSFQLTLEKALVLVDNLVGKYAHHAHILLYVENFCENQFTCESDC